MSAEVQRSVYNALVAASLPGVSTIRDTPITKPSSSDYPFIEIGSSQDIPVDAGGDYGVEHYIDVHSYSRTDGQLQIKQISGAIYDALHGTDLLVEGKASAHCWLDTSRIIADRDGLTRHSVQTFRIVHRE